MVLRQITPIAASGSANVIYSQMVLDAIKALKERNGSSIQAIKKHITATHPALNFTPHQMRSALKKGVESGKFVKVGNQQHCL